ncbi:hypothetical protein [Nitratireductor sp. GCM10026969]|uniref:hypothetical protein n=1 Tax=Nitratireductor sp. GCM10026969 TaxID=3252645 RepID=UPI00361BD83C
MAGEPGFAAAQDIGALLLGGVRRLFLNVMLRRPRNSQTVGGAARTPRSAANRAPISASVMSGVSSMRPSMKASCASSFERDGWPCLRACVSPDTYRLNPKTDSAFFEDALDTTSTR